MKMPIKSCVVAFCIILLLAGWFFKDALITSSPIEAARTDWLNPLDPIKPAEIGFHLDLAKRVFDKFEPVRATLVIRNNTREPIQFGLPKGFRLFERNFNISVTCSVAGEERASEYRIQTEKGARFGSLSSDLIPLKPGHIHAITIPLDVMFAIDHPGAYTVKSVFGLRELGKYRINDVLYEENGQSLPELKFTVRNTDPETTAALARELRKGLYTNDLNLFEFRSQYLLNIGGSENIEAVLTALPDELSPIFADSLLCTLKSMKDRLVAVRSAAMLANRGPDTVGRKALGIVRDRGERRDALLLAPLLQDGNINTRWEAVMAIGFLLGLDKSDPVFVLKEAPGNDHPVIADMKNRLDRLANDKK